MFFGFTHCPDVCPTTLATLAQVAKPPASPSLRVLLISVDPERDTPERLEHYVHAFDPKFIGATGSQAAIDAVTKRVRRRVQRVDLPGGDYTMDHSAAVFLLERPARSSSPCSRRPSTLAGARGGPARRRAACLRSPMNAKLFVGMQYLLPQHLLTSVVYSVDARARAAGEEHADLELHARTSSPT